MKFSKSFSLYFCLLMSSISSLIQYNKGKTLVSELFLDSFNKDYNWCKYYHMITDKTVKCFHYYLLKCSELYIIL